MSIENFEKLISKNIYNKEVWEDLLIEVKSKDEDKVRYVYEKFLQHFPTSVSLVSFFFFLDDNNSCNYWSNL